MTCYAVNADRAWRFDYDLAGSRTLTSGTIAYCFAIDPTDCSAGIGDEFDSSWAFRAVNSSDAQGDGPLEAAIDGVHDLIGRGEFGFLDRVLRQMPENANRFALLGIARSTFPVRSKLASWRLYIAKCRAGLAGRGLDAEKLLKGLA